ncbi:MAG: FAD-binding oxidoreductase [Desulfohalobiaceae bacterium]|nr:FAD-binding oxidoreductase [Desulfohalobiaceae bacterium]
MSTRSPHITLPQSHLINRVLQVPRDEFAAWPASVQELAMSLAAELFIIRYNPFIPAEEVRKSVFQRLEAEKQDLGEDYLPAVQQGLEQFWHHFQEEQSFREKVIRRLERFLPREHIYTSPASLVQFSTDATDLRQELPMLIVAPMSTREVQDIVSLANEMEFYLLPRGGGSGLTGGAIPLRPRSVILSLSRMKSIRPVDTSNKVLCAQAGVITQDAIQAASEQGLLLTVDPASKASSSLGGNISENAGGPFAFEYGTTLDNILSYKMVRPDGSLIEITRRDHPRRKIMPHDEAVFDIRDTEGRILESVTLSGDSIRSAGLGKDVSNKYLSGLPGIQKEGVDGVITEACFTLYDQLPLSSTLCLEFYGDSMRNAMLLIKDLVHLRDRIRHEGNLVKMSALEEFGTKYVQAIGYRKKSSRYEGEPISVLLVQLDSSHQEVLEQVTWEIVHIAESYHNVDVFVAGDSEESEAFWQDRHSLSAITKHTSGFKINEDVVIPIDLIPEFSDFIEGLNLYYLALAYRKALQQATELEDIPPGDSFIDMEQNVASGILKGETGTSELAEQEFELQIHYFFRDLMSRYPQHEDDLDGLEEDLFATRIMVANHMHAGDGNCHVNIPVNSNDPEMIRLAEEAAGKVFEKVLQQGGSISGEHGIGITKIGYLERQRIEELTEYKARIDPGNILNPDKLTRESLELFPYTFSFNELLQDLGKSSLPHKDKLIDLLQNIQNCSRCGKCKQVCPMYCPEQGFLHHPRNKIIALGALLEGYAYTRQKGLKADKALLETLQDLVERCTACGKCTEVCPVSIQTPQQMFNMRSFLEENRDGGRHPLKTRLLQHLFAEQGRLASAAKTASLSQKLQNRVSRLIPKGLRDRADHPLLAGPGPDLSFTSLEETLHLERNNIFLTPADDPETAETVLYFPGCGASLFYRDIGLAAIYLLLVTGNNVVLPERNACCGYPLLAAGCMQTYAQNEDKVKDSLNELLDQAREYSLSVSSILTSCGTCREALGGLHLGEGYEDWLQRRDLLQHVIERSRLRLKPQLSGLGDPERLLYHPACHSEWQGVPPHKSGFVYARELSNLLGTAVEVTPGCCGESGLGAMTSPHIYSTLRRRKTHQLESDLAGYPNHLPVLVGCPSCKVGLSRIAAAENWTREVQHTLEFLARLQLGGKWRSRVVSKIVNCGIEETA